MECSAELINPNNIRYSVASTMQAIKMTELPRTAPTTTSATAGMARRKKIIPKLKLLTNCSPQVRFNKTVESLSAVNGVFIFDDNDRHHQEGDERPSRSQDAGNDFADL